MERYAIDILRPDGSRWRTVHLAAVSPADALTRAESWARRELRDPRYTAANAAPCSRDDDPSEHDAPRGGWVARATSGTLPPLAFGARAFVTQ